MTKRLKSADYDISSGPESLMTPSSSMFTATLGRVAGVVYGIGPLVNFPGSGWEEPMVARSLVPIGEKDIDAEVALAFEDQGRTKPLIVGLIQGFATLEPPISGDDQSSALDLTVDQNRLLLSAQDEVVLRCGKASITLTRAGKVLISGEYVVSTSSGANKIRGASVQLN